MDAKKTIKYHTSEGSGKDGAVKIERIDTRRCKNADDLV